MERKHKEKAFVEHYELLFGHCAPGIEAFQTDFFPLIPRLEFEVKYSLEQSITMSEVKKAMDELQGGKTPIPDGTNEEFYKAFGDAVSYILLNVFR